VPTTLTGDVQRREVMTTTRPVRRRHARSRSLAPQLWVAAAFSVITAIISIFFWPGQMDPDSVDEITEAATGHFIDWHTPILSALWRIPYLLGITSPGWVLAVGIFTLLVGFYLILRVRFGRLASTCISVACLIWPPVLSWGVHVGRDTWFIGLLMCAFGFAARVVRMGEDQQRFNLICALVCAFLCCATWQIGLVPIFVLFVVLALQILPMRVRRRSLVALGVGLAMCAGVFVLQIGIEKALNTEVTNSQQGTYIYDLGQLSKMNDQVLFPRDMLLPHKDALAFLKTIPVGDVDGIIFGKTAVVAFFVQGAQLSSLQHAWFNAILHHPWDYLKERTDLLWSQLAISHPSVWTFQYPPDPRQYLPLANGLQADGLNYLSTFSTGINLYGDILYTAWFYLVLAVASVPLLWRRAERGARVIAAFALSIVLVETAVFFTVPGLVYRYSYPVVVAGTVLAPVLLPRWRRSGAQGPETV
jgi:hypothetical protein